MAYTNDAQLDDAFRMTGMDVTAGFATAGLAEGPMEHAGSEYLAFADPADVDDEEDEEDDLEDEDDDVEDDEEEEEEDDEDEDLDDEEEDVDEDEEDEEEEDEE
jgi:hypothetical protein